MSVILISLSVSTIWQNLRKCAGDINPKQTNKETFALSECHAQQYVIL